MTGIGSTDRNRSAGIDLLSLPGIFSPVLLLLLLLLPLLIFLAGFIIADEAIVYDMNRSLFNTLI